MINAGPDIGISSPEPIRKLHSSGFHHQWSELAVAYAQPCRHAPIARCLVWKTACLKDIRASIALVSMVLRVLRRGSMSNSSTVAADIAVLRRVLERAAPHSCATYSHVRHTSGSSNDAWNAIVQCNASAPAASPSQDCARELIISLL